MLKPTIWFHGPEMGKEWVENILGKTQWKKDGTTVNYHKNFSNGTHDSSSNLTYVSK